jgi:hypothetical protein
MVSFDAKHGHPRIVGVTPTNALKIMKNKIFHSFQEGFSVGLVSQHPHAHKNGFQLP